MSIKVNFRVLAGVLLLSAMFACDVGETVDSNLQTYPVEDFSNAIAYPVIAVVDGDTIKIQSSGKEVSVRLIGVNTPETVHPTKPVEAFGKVATNFTKNLLLGEHVYLRSETGKDPLVETSNAKANRDRYGRLLSYVYRAPDGLFVNLEIVRQGYGHVYVQSPFKHMELFQQYSNHARRVGKGVYLQDVVEKGNNTPVDTPIDELSLILLLETLDNGDMTVYVTDPGSKYHLERCSDLGGILIPISIRKARDRYDACSQCIPLWAR